MTQFAAYLSPAVLAGVLLASVLILYFLKRDRHPARTSSPGDAQFRVGCGVE